MLKYLLDTNVVIYVLKRRPIEVLEIFNRNVNRTAISAITLSELMYCAEKSNNITRNLEVIEDFVGHLEVLPYDANASQHYEMIRSDLEKKGEVICVNDIHAAQSTFDRRMGERFSRTLTLNSKL